MTRGSRPGYTPRPATRGPCTSTVTAVPVPIDCVDHFTETYYARPERFLEPAVRQAQSAWGFVPPADAERAVERLRNDLASGEWDRRYGHLRTQPEFVGSLRLIIARPHGGTGPV